MRAAGTARIRNSLLTGNGTAAAGEAPAALTSTYNDLYGNQNDYAGAGAGTGDFSTAVTFTDFAVRDFRLAGPQRSTDKGDPADDVGDEPAPNGGRINLGAFGGTADAELTAPSTGVGSSTSPTAGPTADPHHVAPTPTPKPPSQSPADDQAGGCSVAPTSARACRPRLFALAAIAITASAAAARRNQREPAARALGAAGAPVVARFGALLELIEQVHLQQRDLPTRSSLPSSDRIL